MDRKLRELVKQRSNGCCEYCRLPEGDDVMPFQVDHIIAEFHRGDSAPSNLAWSCYDCNVFKGVNLSGIDPLDGALVRLFHPRQDLWENHFRQIKSGEIVGLSPIGRTTIETLRMNITDRVDHRRLLLGLE